ncbi:protein hinderin-like [Lytechinus variegatus]|uniref:protein hinderin-like n=1 Tax=Lytechinus variegatus TaxID=7654 RepID=UPI001BB2B6C2|nr:protein hinderin-like [Lytechinus variegatus]
MENREYSCVFWSRDESDADLTDMAQRSAHVPGVTDTAASRKRIDSSEANFSSLTNKQKTSMYHSQKKKAVVTSSVIKSSLKSENPSKVNKQSTTKEQPSLKDLKPEDKKRIANLIKELAKIGEEKEVAKEQLEVERKENEMKTRKLQAQIQAILCERENIQQQYLECQKLLSSYQSKVSQEQKNTSDPIHDGSSSQKGHKSKDGWSPLKENVRTISPTSDHPTSKADQEFVELQSVPVYPSDEKSQRSGGPDGSYSTNKHVISEKQFNPVLSSTHRKHHQSRVPSSGAEDMRATQSGNSLNGFPSLQAQRREEPSLSDSRHMSTVHGSNRKVSRRSQDTFLPMTEVTDDSAITPTLHAPRRERREIRNSSERTSWVSLPEVDGQPAYSYELHERGPGASEIYSGSISHQKRQERQDYHSLTPEQRQRQLGSLKEKLQQEQEWLQQKLQEQEHLLHQKRFEIERQKEELSQLEDTGYEQVRRKYLRGSAREKQRERTGVGGERKSRFNDVVSVFPEDQYHRVVPGEGRKDVTLSWQQHGSWDEEQPLSTNYPPDEPREMAQQNLTESQFGHYQEEGITGYEENYYQGYDDEVEDAETWYQMREATEGADNGGSIQGYVSLHPQQPTRKQGALHQSAAATSHIYQSRHNSGLRHTTNNAEAGMKKGYTSASRTSEPPKQYGNISTLLDEEGLTGLSLNGSNSPYIRPESKPRPGTTTNPNLKRRGIIQPLHQTHPHSQDQPERRIRSAGQVSGRLRHRVAEELYNPQLQRGKAQDLTKHPTPSQALMDSSQEKGSLHSYTDAAREDDALHAHLVQRSHQVIREIGMLLNQSAEMGEEEESKVLEDIFFLK